MSYYHRYRNGYGGLNVISLNHHMLPCWRSSRDALASTAALKQGWADRDAVDRERFEFVAGEYGLTVTQRNEV